MPIEYRQRLVVGILGTAAGMHVSLGVSAAVLLVGAVVAGWYALRGPRTGAH